MSPNARVSFAPSLSLKSSKSSTTVSLSHFPRHMAAPKQRRSTSLRDHSTESEKMEGSGGWDDPLDWFKLEVATLCIIIVIIILYVNTCMYKHLHYSSLSVSMTQEPHPVSRSVSRHANYKCLLEAEQVMVEVRILIAFKSFYNQFFFQFLRLNQIFGTRKSRILPALLLY